MDTLFPVNRRQFAQHSAAAVGAVLAQQLPAHSQSENPNVILIITDDQGYGDFGAHDNPAIRTPHLNRFAKQSVHVPQFYVSPVCAPTRASLMTGRYNYRTGVVDTYLGRAMMHGDETTLAELLGGAGYRTGIFGKWHLGDNVPMRPIDQGFQEALVHNGGGIGQPSDPPGNRYFDPMLSHNGEWKRYEGYCTDIFTDACIDFIESDDDRPFFAYLSTNAPHTPLQIDAKYYQPYIDQGLDETTAKIYGMVENIDENIGKLMKSLDRKRIADNTIVIFMTDNGPQQERYTYDLRGRKGSVFQGGIRVPFYFRWPERLRAGASINQNAAHIDVLPTLLDACGVDKPDTLNVDGRSLMPLLSGESVQWDDRNLFFQWHRGDEPERFRDCAVIGPRYKLVNGEMLFDLQADPGEKNNIAAQRPDIVSEMRQAYLDWFRDVSGERGYAPPRIHIGSPKENPAILTRQDWRGPEAGWGKKSTGYWEVEVLEEKRYDIRLRFQPVTQGATAYFKHRSILLRHELKPGDAEVLFEHVTLPQGPGRLEAWLDLGGETVGMNYVDVIQP